MIYFDNAATTGKKPPEVTAAVKYALEFLSANPGRGGYEASVKASAEVFSCREKAAKLFGADAERVIFTANCTASLNMIIKGICKKGDKIVCSSLEHNAVARPLYKLGAMGAEIASAEVIFGDKAATVRSFERNITSDTRLVVCTYASNVTGTVLPIREIGEICYNLGVPFAVDAAQAAGVFDIDMKRDKIDYLAVAPHKGLYAPMGTGMLISLGEIPDTLIEGGTGSQSYSPVQPKDFPDRFESGTVNLPGIAGIKAGIDFVKGKGIGSIAAHETKISRYIYEGLSRLPGVKIYSEKPETGKTAPIISFNIVGKDSTETAELLGSRGIAVRGGLHCAPMAHRSIGTIDVGTVRISPSVYNTENDAEYLLSTVKKIIKI